MISTPIAEPVAACSRRRLVRFRAQFQKAQTESNAVLVFAYRSVKQARTDFTSLLFKLVNFRGVCRVSHGKEQRFKVRFIRAGVLQSQRIAHLNELRVLITGFCKHIRELLAKLAVKSPLVGSRSTSPAGSIYVIAHGNHRSNPTVCIGNG
jgi:hypothetical protein